MSIHSAVFHSAVLLPVIVLVVLYRGGREFLFRSDRAGHVKLIMICSWMRDGREIDVSAA